MKKTTFLISGRHAVIEALKNPERKVFRLFITEDALKKVNKQNQNLNLLKKVHVFYKSKKELDNLIGKDDISHQGIIAEVEHILETFILLERWILMEMEIMTLYLINMQIGVLFHM